jgi:AcrR family transcriptional regulator
MSKAKTPALLSRKEQIVRCAALLFKQHGFKATTMRMLAEAMGMEAASLYNHIRTKEELLQAICFSVAAAFNSHLAGVEKELLQPGQRVESIIRFHVHMWLTRYDDMYVSNRDWKHMNEPGLGEFILQRRHYEKRMAAVIQEGIQQEQFCPVHPYAAVLAILAGVRSMEYWQRNKRQVSSRQMADDLVALLLHGLQKNRDTAT